MNGKLKVFVQAASLLILSTACNNEVRKDVPKENAAMGTDHPKLVRTLNSPRYGNVNGSLQDKAGNLWFATVGNGVYKYDGKSFIQFTEADGLTSNLVYGIFEDRDGKIWLATEAGLGLYDGKTFSTVTIPLRKNLIPNKNRKTHDVFSIMQDRSGKLWFATIDGVYIYDGKTFTPFVFSEAEGGYMSPNNNAEFVLEDRSGNFWFGGRGLDGVFKYDGKTITNLKLPTNGKNNWAWPVLQDRDANIWFTNWGGAYRYDGITFIPVEISSGEFKGFTRIIEARNGDLWFGGDALYKYDGASFKSFIPREGLSSPAIWSILEDKTGKLWVGTRETGLYLFDGKTFTSYSEYKPK